MRTTFRDPRTSPTVGLLMATARLAHPQRTASSATANVHTLEMAMLQNCVWPIGSQLHTSTLTENGFASSTPLSISEKLFASGPRTGSHSTPRPFW